MNEPLSMLEENRRVELYALRSLIRDPDFQANGGMGGWLRGAAFGYRMALRHARRLLKGVRARRASGWRLLWVDADTWQDILTEIPPGGYHEAHIE